LVESPYHIHLQSRFAFNPAKQFQSVILSEATLRSVAQSKNPENKSPAVPYSGSSHDTSGLNADR
jgi:hypothetical protein